MPDIRFVRSLGDGRRDAYLRIPTLTLLLLQNLLYISQGSLDQLFSTCRSQPLQESHIRCPAYQIFTLHFTTVQNYNYEFATK